uniref:Uncharacterized protein n=1 Tax=Caenorhabditis japonica TaxID=281687 RepID=A0A8R1ID41_CAEJA
MLLNAMNDRKQENQPVESISSTSVAQELSTPLTHFNEENEDLFTEFFVVPPSAQNVSSVDVNNQSEIISPGQIDQPAQEQNSLLLGYQTVPEPNGNLQFGQECYGQVQLIPEQFQQIPVEQSYDQGYTSDQSFPEELNAYPQLQQIGYHQEHQQPNYWNNVKHENAPYLFQN